MKESRCFSCKEKDYTTYDCSKKGKIATISESVDEDCESQEKK